MEDFKKNGPPNIDLSDLKKRLYFLQSAKLTSGVNKESVTHNLQILRWVTQELSKPSRFVTAPKPAPEPKKKPYEKRDQAVIEPKVEEDENSQDAEALHAGLVILAWFWSFGVGRES